MKPKFLAKLISAAGAALLALALLVPAAQATTPNPGYERFAGCPDPKTENPKVEGCFLSEINGGHFQMGSKDVPITKPMFLSGGFTGDGKFVFNSKGGLSKAKQVVPGGITGLTGLDWLVNFLNLEGLKLYAETELAGTPGNPLLNPFELPIKVHLINPVLGNNCYIGSTANPIKLSLTFFTTSPPGPNTPISGKFPEFSFDFEKGLTFAKNGELVDNAFAAPGASGCVLTLFGFLPISINGLVNSQSGLPAAAGTNETRQENDSEIAVATPYVYP